MADTLKTVKSSGGDYTSLSSWEAGQQGTISAGDTQTAECYSFEDTTSVYINGWTTVATGYIVIKGAASDRTSSNTGKWSTARYRLSGALDLNEEYCRFINLQVAIPEDEQGIDTFYSGTGITHISGCIIKGDGSDQKGIIIEANANATTYIWNCLVYGIDSSASGRRGIEINIGTVSIYSNTVIGGYYGILDNGGTVTEKNNYVGGATSCYTGGTLTTCASSDSTGTVGLRTIAVNTDTFVNVTGGSEDYHLAVDGLSPLQGVGTDTSGDAAPMNFTDDIDGETRSAPWDIGADEYAGADSMSYFSDSTVADGTNVVSYINKTILVNAIQSDSSDNYFDSTDKLNKVYVYYTDPGNRELKSIRHEIDGTNLKGYVSWSSFAGDGTWQKIKVKAYDLENALHVLNRAAIGSGEDITHSSGIMHLNRI